MKPWSTPADLHAKLQKLWDRGEVLRAVLASELPLNAEREIPSTTLFPLALNLCVPSSSEISARFDAVRVWAAALANCQWLRIEWQDLKHRIHGQQRLPAKVWIDSADQACAWLGKRAEQQRFNALTQSTRDSHPALVPWLAAQPLAALALAGQWPRLLALLDWRLARANPGIYLRQVDVPGVHSKFIERHRTVLAELFDLMLPPTQINHLATGASRFATRYQFREIAPRVRLRVLDPAITTLPGCVCPDLKLDAANFARLKLPIRHVVITENEINFLALPQAQHSIAIFGAGYGFAALALAPWLAHCQIIYWGDIDTHGFAILDQLRAHLPHARAVLMDRATLTMHQALWGTETTPTRVDLHRLQADERGLYDDLRDNRISPNLRLEQEHIGYQHVCQQLALHGLPILS